MPGYSDEAQSHVSNDAKSRRKLLDQRRMEYRRAIESYAENRRLEWELASYPELIVADSLAASQSQHRDSARGH